MRLDVNEENCLEAREVYSGLTFVTSEGNRYGVCMRDDTIEITPVGDAPSPRVWTNV